MKKWTALLLCMLMVLSFTACGQGAADPDTAPTEKVIHGPTSVDEAIELSMNAQFLRDKSAYQIAIPDDAKVYIKNANSFTFDEAVDHICKGVDMGGHMTLDWQIVSSSPCSEEDKAALKTKLTAYGMNVNYLGTAENYSLMLTSSLDGVEETMPLDTVIFKYEGRFFTMYLIEDLMGRVPFMNIGER